jgi:hypothetical protein
MRDQNQKLEKIHVTTSQDLTSRLEANKKQNARISELEGKYNESEKKHEEFKKKYEEYKYGYNKLKEE